MQNNEKPNVYQHVNTKDSQYKQISSIKAGYKRFNVVNSYFIE